MSCPSPPTKTPWPTTPQAPSSSISSSGTPTSSPSARSPAERRLDRIHGEDGKRYEELKAELDERNVELIDMEVKLARCIAAHPMVSGDPLDVLAWCEHDGKRLARK